MELPASVGGLIVALFALLPGVPAEWCYRLVAGIDWREDKWQRTLRLLGFSAFGLALYAAIAPSFRLPQPFYLFPTTLALVTPAELPRLSVAFLGHVTGAVTMAVVAAVAAPRIARLARRLSFVTAWDSFINGRVGHRWVVVTLGSGEAYAGYIDVADISVAASDRDLVLREPAHFIAAEKIYRVSEYDSLFIVGSNIASVAAIAEPSDQRITVRGQSLFPANDSVPTDAA